MKICRGCCYPVEQCKCTEHEKNQWLWKRENELFEWVEHYDMKMLGVQTDREIFRAQPEEKAARIQACEENKGALDYHQTNSFELDDDFVEVIQTLWSKGYDTCFCCSGHPDKKEYNFYVAFTQDYEFDFTTLPFKSGWSYCRGGKDRRSFAFYYQIPKNERRKRKGADLDQYFVKQRDAFIEWVNQLPPARIANHNQKPKGHRPYRQTGR